MGLHPVPAGNLRSFMEALAEQLVQQLLQGCRGLVEAAAASGAGGGGGGTGGTGRRGRDRRGAEGAGAAGLQGEGASVEQLVQLVGDLAFLERVLQPLLGSPLQADMQEAQVCDRCGAFGGAGICRPTVHLVWRAGDGELAGRVGLLYREALACTACECRCQLPPSSHTLNICSNPPTWLHFWLPSGTP